MHDDLRIRQSSIQINLPTMRLHEVNVSTVNQWPAYIQHCMTTAAGNTRATGVTTQQQQQHHLPHHHHHQQQQITSYKDNVYAMVPHKYYYYHYYYVTFFNGGPDVASQNRDRTAHCVVVAESLGVKLSLSIFN